LVTTDSLLRFRLKRSLETLAKKEGRHTELISLYIPPERQISDVMNSLRQEQGTASNIKSRSTRKNVQDAIAKVMQELKLYNRAPPNGMIIFCGAIPQNGPGSERMELYVIEPLEPINTYYYRCDSQFHLQPLREMLREKETYGILVIDGNDATIATLRGRRMTIEDNMSSGIPGKHRRGGQSAQRFERLREQEVNYYYTRVGEHFNRIFLDVPELKGVIVGGPGPTKEDFLKGKHIHYTFEDVILAVIDTAYTGKQGVKEVVEKSPEILSKVRYFEEKKLVEKFLQEIGKDSGLVTYGEDEVRRLLLKRVVDMVLLSEELDKVRAVISCGNCSHTEELTITRKQLATFEQEITGKICPNCSGTSMKIEESKDVIDEFAELSSQTGTQLEVISIETEEGVMLKEGFGGVAAMLRYKLN